MKSIPHAPAPTVATFPADPILAALARHREAWADLMNAPDEGLTAATHAQRIALAVVLVTPCTTTVGAEALLRHLRACLGSNGVTLTLGPQTVGLVTARAGDLALLLELPGARAPTSLGEAAMAVIRSLNRAGEVAAAIAIIAGGIILTGAASLL